MPLIISQLYLYRIFFEKKLQKNLADKKIVRTFAAQSTLKAAVFIGNMEEQLKRRSQWQIF
jgi:hypothetical protein